MHVKTSTISKMRNRSTKLVGPVNEPTLALRLKTIGPDFSVPENIGSLRVGVLSSNHITHVRRIAPHLMRQNEGQTDSVTCRQGFFKKSSATY